MRYELKEGNITIIVLGSPTPFNLGPADTSVFLKIGDRYIHNNLLEHVKSAKILKALDGFMKKYYIKIEE